LDGNRRWAKKALTMSKNGHFKGADAVENFLDWCEELDIKIITLYVLSTENLDRKDNELEYLYELIRQRLEKLYSDPRIHKNKMRVKAMGRTELLPDAINDVLKRLDDATKGYDNHYLNIAIAYGGQNVLVEGTQGTFLSLWHGTYPFVTSKDVTASGICADIGLGPKNVDDVMVVFKSYVTRVGTGTLENELPMDEVAARGWSEVGTVTGRQRRAAEFNFELAKRAVMLNSATQIGLTKLDVLFSDCAHKNSFDDLSNAAKQFITKTEDALDVPVTLIGTGPGVDDIIDLRQ
jgi:adenylosuccinate synthase